jgi:pimeloyl-ACP methyl ester carboxylesterase
MPTDSTFKILSIDPLSSDSAYPAGTIRLEYRSAYDGTTDWAIYLPGDVSRNTIVYLHGSFGYADQIFTRTDIRDFWLSRIIAGNHPLLSINMRGTSYMSPAATQDFTDLLDYCQREYCFDKVVLLGGSGGASSALAYACIHPERVDGIIAMGMCDIFARLDFARNSSNEILQELARVTFAAYGGNLEEQSELYRQRSVLLNADKLTMPIIITMGESDELIPVTETRKIAKMLSDKLDFTYVEIPKGNHDSALWVDVDLQTLSVDHSATITT